jgi:hypothetical protein
MNLAERSHGSGRYPQSFLPVPESLRIYGLFMRVRTCYRELLQYHLLIAGHCPRLPPQSAWSSEAAQRSAPTRKHRSPACLSPGDSPTKAQLTMAVQREVCTNCPHQNSSALPIYASTATMRLVQCHRESYRRLRPCSARAGQTHILCRTEHTL